MMMKKIALVLCLLASTACTKIHFDNGDVDIVPTPTNAGSLDDWHHIAILTLIEVSEPVNLDQKCNGGEWESVQTQTSLTNGIVAAVVGGLYNPKTALVTCE